MDLGMGPIDVRALDRPARRRAASAAALRTVAVLAGLLLLYAVFPVGGFNDDNPTGAWIRLMAVVVVFLLVLGLQVHIVLDARAPQIRAVEAVIECVVAFNVLFALLYLSMAGADQTSFSEPLNRVDALYFTGSTFATVGFGDITPTTDLARSVVTIQILGGLGVVVMIAKVVFYAAKEGTRRRR
jgi:voltage-gated potassium channel